MSYSGTSMRAASPESGFSSASTVLTDSDDKSLSPVLSKISLVEQLIKPVGSLPKPCASSNTLFPAARSNKVVTAIFHGDFRTHHNSIGDLKEKARKVILHSERIIQRRVFENPLHHATRSIEKTTTIQPLATKIDPQESVDVITEVSLLPGSTETPLTGRGTISTPFREHFLRKKPLELINLNEGGNARVR